MGRRNIDRYRPDDWRAVSPTVQAAIDNRWRVFTECDVCCLRIVADLKRIASAKGRAYRLWGQTARCRRMGCPGQVVFHAQPPDAGVTLVMA